MVEMVYKVGMEEHQGDQESKVRQRTWGSKDQGLMDNQRPPGPKGEGSDGI